MCIVIVANSLNDDFRNCGVFAVFWPLLPLAKSGSPLYYFGQAGALQHFEWTLGRKEVWNVYNDYNDSCIIVILQVIFTYNVCICLHMCCKRCCHKRYIKLTRVLSLGYSSYTSFLASRCRLKKVCFPCRFF